MNALGAIETFTDRAQPSSAGFTLPSSLRAAEMAISHNPLFCVSPAQLAQTAQRFLNGFAGEVSYAVKANPQGIVVSSLYNAGIRVFDVASLEEMSEICTRFEDVKVHYHNPAKSRHEVYEALYTFGCRRFSVDCAEELHKIADIARDTQGIEIAVRFRLAETGASVHDFTSKFGADEASAVTLLKQVCDLGFSPVLTFHPGSQCTNPQAWEKHIHAAANIARESGVTLARLNVGGGFPAHYPASPAPDLEHIFETISNAASTAFDGSPPALECEPGRALVAGAASLLTRVKLVRRDTGEVFLNDGIYGGLLEGSQAAALSPAFRVIRDGKIVHGATKDFTVYGPTCDPLDVLPNKLALPADIQEDDVVEFGGLGAYGCATATGFNGYGAAETALVEAVFAP